MKNINTNLLHVSRLYDKEYNPLKTGEVKILSVQIMFEQF